MSGTINYGIDLGTSNSLIARSRDGQIEVFKNPNGFKETLPSVVGFRNDRILVGDQARSYAERDPKSVVTRFKRRMGTTETFKIRALGLSKSPVELSAYVLKELKTFVRPSEALDCAVITIPASFDTVQSNATKEAGKLAGFETVVLLQEPIAASLAYSNRDKKADLRNSRWLVYDLGGGTFDVALVRVIEGELTVVDHAGDNYLGGTDFDAALVEKVLLPQIERLGAFSDLNAQMRSESGKYNHIWYSLIRKAEEAKVELTSRPSAEVDLGSIQDFKDERGQVVDKILSITRSEFEAVIRESVDRTVSMMKEILTRNSLQPSDLKFVLMVGGSTYIPYVRKRVEELMGITVNTNIDPTNAIAVGAALYAGTKERALTVNRAAIRSDIKVRASYNRTSQERDELFSAKIDGNLEGLQYRIVGEDGAYDSGLKRVSARIVEELPLREGAFNIFSFSIFDRLGNEVETELTSIQIHHGRYSIAGQMLPEDICLVKDDLSARDTRLTLLFGKNAVLPTRTKQTVEVARTIVKGSQDELKIMVVEGPSDRHSSTNKPIGILVITGKQISRDLIKGTDVDLTFQMSESRDLSVSAFLSGTSQEFSEVFVPSQRSVSAKILASEILMLESKVRDEMDDPKGASDPDSRDQLRKALGGVESLMSEAAAVAEDDVTDQKFQLEDKKRRLAQDVFQLTSKKRLERAKAAYENKRADVAALLTESGNDREKHIFSEIRNREPTFMNSTQPDKIQAAIEELEQIAFQILLRTPEFLIGMFKHLVDRRVAMNDQLQSKQLIENGKRAIEREDWSDLKDVNTRLWMLIPAEEKASEEMRIYTGIV